MTFKFDPKFRSFEIFQNEFQLESNFKISKLLPWEHFLVLKIQAKLKFQPSSFYFAKKEFWIFDILRIFQIFLDFLTQNLSIGTWNFNHCLKSTTFQKLSSLAVQEDEICLFEC
jgi:hypothetical protein